MHNELIQVWHELAQRRKEVVPLQEHQALLKKLKDLSTTEDEIFSQLREERMKVKKAQDQVEKAKKQIDMVFSLYSDVLTYRAPATNYALLFLERYLLLKIKVVRVGNPTTFKTIEEFF